MKSSLLTDPIKIYNIVTEDTACGMNKDTYVLGYSTRAHVIFNSQDRVVSEGQVYFPQDRTLVVRSYVPVDERSRIEWNDKMWRITSINYNKYYNNKEIHIVEING